MRNTKLLGTKLVLQQGIGIFNDAMIKLFEANSVAAIKTLASNSDIFNFKPSIVAPTPRFFFATGSEGLSLGGLRPRRPRATSLNVADWLLVTYVLA
jgi:hypothetical protein